MTSPKCSRNCPAPLSRNFCGPAQDQETGGRTNRDLTAPPSLRWSAKRGARFSILARTASSWLALPISFICSTDSAEQRRAGIDGKIVQKPLGGADRVWALARDLARHLEGRRARVVADPRREAVTQGLLRRKNPARIGQLAQDVVAHQARQDRRSRHVRHQPPFDLHDRHPRVGARKRMSAPSAS